MSYHNKQGMGQMFDRGLPGLTVDSGGLTVGTTTMKSSAVPPRTTALPIDTSAISALVPSDCPPQVAYAAPPDIIPDGGVVVFVWPMVQWPSSARNVVGASPPGSVAATAAPDGSAGSGGNLSYTGLPSAPSGATGSASVVAPVDIGPMKQWVQRMQLSRSVALAGFIPRPGNDQSRSKGVAWVLAYTQGDSVDSFPTGQRLNQAGIAQQRVAPALQLNLGPGLLAVVPMQAGALPAPVLTPGALGSFDWTKFADNWPRANSRILQAVLMVEGSFASLVAAFAIGLSNVNTRGPANAVQSAANALGTTVAQGRAALTSVTAARIAAAQAAQSIPGIVDAARRTISSAADAASVDAAATAAQAQINALLASTSVWSSAIATATTMAPQLSQAAAAAATQFTPASVVALAMTPEIQAAIVGQAFEISKNAVKCQVLQAVAGALIPAYVALMQNVNAANALAPQLIASAQSTALSGFAGLSGYRPRRRSWFGRMLGGLGITTFGGGGTMTLLGSGIPSIDALQSVATQAATDIQGAAAAAKTAIAAAVKTPVDASGGGGAVTTGATTCPPGQFFDTTMNACRCPEEAATIAHGPPPPGFHYETTDACGHERLVPDAAGGPTTPGAPSKFPWVPVVAGVAVVAVGGYFVFGGSKSPKENRVRHNGRRRSKRSFARHSHR